MWPTRVGIALCTAAWLAAGLTVPRALITDAEFLLDNNLDSEGSNSVGVRTKRDTQPYDEFLAANAQVNRDQDELYAVFNDVRRGKPNADEYLKAEEDLRYILQKYLDRLQATMELADQVSAGVMHQIRRREREGENLEKRLDADELRFLILVTRMDQMEKQLRAQMKKLQDANASGSSNEHSVEYAKLQDMWQKMNQVTDLASAKAKKLADQNNAILHLIQRDVELHAIEQRDGASYAETKRQSLDPYDRTVAFLQDMDALERDIRTLFSQIQADSEGTEQYATDVANLNLLMSTYNDYLQKAEAASRNLAPSGAGRRDVPTPSKHLAKRIQLAELLVPAAFSRLDIQRETLVAQVERLHRQTATSDQLAYEQVQLELQKQKLAQVTELLSTAIDKFIDMTNAVIANVQRREAPATPIVNSGLNELDPADLIPESLDAVFKPLQAQMNQLLRRIQSNPTPNQADILQLQLITQQYANLIAVVSAVQKGYLDAVNAVLENMG